ncbi:MAG: hypothetical protein IKA12_01970 [Clostridia bacterium]|nr:hypothetical protein [Clostridia bacterium]
MEDKRAKTIMILSIVLLILDALFLILPIHTFTKTITLGGVSETLTVKASFLNIFLDSEREVLSSLGDVGVDNIKISELCVLEDLYFQISFLIGVPMVILIIAMVLFERSALNGYTNKHHLLYLDTTSFLFLAAALQSCSMFNPSMSNTYFVWQLDIFLSAFIILAHITITVIIGKYLDKLNSWAVYTFSSKYKNQDKDFLRELISNVSEFVLEARLASPNKIKEALLSKLDEIEKSSEKGKIIQNK